jgi:hypothetical protein
MKLTDTQLVLLSAASQREDHAIDVGPDLKGAASQKVVGRLLREGLIEETPAGGSVPVWRRDDDSGPIGLRLTDCPEPGLWKSCCRPAHLAALPHLPPLHHDTS